MTTDKQPVDLVPLPDWGGAQIIPDNLIRDYARANVARATAAKDAAIVDLQSTIEALRLRALAGEEANNTLRAMCLIEEGRTTKAEARAERLAEALREARDYVTTELAREREAFKGYEHCSDVASIEADLAKIDALLREQEEGQ